LAHEHFRPNPAGFATGAGTKDAGELPHFSIRFLLPVKIFDRNAQMLFPKVMAAIRPHQSPGHDSAHGQLFNHS
jgi:hypothetical protein